MWAAWVQVLEAWTGSAPRQRSVHIAKGLLHRPGEKIRVCMKSNS